MKRFWWKVYFWLNALLLVLVAIVEFSYPSAPPGLFIADIVVYGVGLTGVYAYVFRKHIFEANFWKYFFWFNVVYSALFLLYAAAPENPLIKQLSFLSYGDSEYLLLTTVIGFLLSTPYLFAMYQLSFGRFIALPEPNIKTIEKNKKWGMMQTAFWGYSLIFICVLLVLSLIPSASGGSATNTSPLDTYSGIIIFAPIFIFWFWVTVEYKKYTWNWWKITLLLNSLLFSGLIVFGSFFYDPISTAESSAEFDWIGVAQTLIILTGLYVFGSEQFQKEEVKIVEPPKRSRRKPQNSSETAIGK